MVCEHRSALIKEGDISVPGRKTHSEIVQVCDIAEWDICGSGPVYSGSDGADVVFPDGDSDMRAVQFMYLYRRFGYQIHGGDPHKSLANYFLSTPDPDVVLWCKPGSKMRWSFGVGISPAFAKQAYMAQMQWRRSANRNPNQWKDHPIYVRIHTAICAAMTELLRPVHIRDVGYNILGCVPDDAPYGRWNAAKHSPQSGYGLGDFDPIKAFDTSSLDGQATPLAADTYQREAARTLVDAPGFKLNDEETFLAWNALGLTGEAGEVADLIKKGVFHRHGVNRNKLISELGDVLWYVAALCSKLKVPMSTVMQRNIDKLRQRYPDGYTIDASKHGGEK